MTLVLVVVVAVAVGLLVGRWWAVLASGVVAATTTFMATSTFAIGDRPVNVMQEDREGLHGYSFLPRLSNIETDMGDLRIGIGAPGYRQRA